MAILTSLPNELLLSIIADVSPLYIESFALSCKRIYYLCIDTIREHDIVRSRLAEMQPLGLLRTLSLHSELALYPISSKLTSTPFEMEFLQLDTSIDAGPLKSDINAWALQSPFTIFHETDERHKSVRDLAMPLMVTRLLNLRKIDWAISYPRYLLEAVSQIVEASREPLSSVRQPLAFGRLNEVRIVTTCDCTYGMGLAVLLAMIPSVRKLKVLRICNTDPFVCPYPRYDSGVTEMILDEYADSSYLVELIKHTNRLQKFTYNHNIYSTGTSAKFEPRHVAEILKQRAGHSLLYLNLSIDVPGCPGYLCRDRYRNHNDLSLGPLRSFSVLRTIVTCVDMFIKTRGLSEFGNGTGTVQRLVSWLPTSLEALVLHQGLEEWDKDTLRMLFRGFRKNKQKRVPNLKLIDFVRCPSFEPLMSDNMKTAFQEMGVKVGYTLYWCRNPECRQVFEQLEDWEGRPWVEALEECCQHEWCG
ncbi:hypothetical protein HO133_003187 [Letharia lupina]|uniref:F-box domain-containing protein n=1 Tax=Letharia lupina TaxID=560253 RepID=A0A8H6CBY0_9LECA|nr:uncharacterized protein HO133_003187 [Letharia lupina]KAF6220753.1 hypothetical protein HO133_003187 [Letharia lupina]